MDARTLARFFKKVEPEPNSGCWIWNGSRKRGGYGTFSRGTQYGGWRLAHRVAWEHWRGPIPEGAHVLHRCDTPPCVNPDHLFLGSHHDNMADMKEKRRHWAHKNGGVHEWPDRLVRGSRVISARLTEHDVRRIRARHSLGEKQTVIASDFAVSKMTVSDIVNRKTWTHI